MADKMDELIKEIEQSIDSTNVKKAQCDRAMRKRRENMDAETKKEAKKKLEESIQKTVDSLGDDLTEADADLLKSIGVDQVVDLPGNSSD